jgi:hypothetical protein
MTIITLICTFLYSIRIHQEKVSTQTVHYGSMDPLKKTATFHVFLRQLFNGRERHMGTVLHVGNHLTVSERSDSVGVVGQPDPFRRLLWIAEHQAKIAQYCDGNGIPDDIADRIGYGRKYPW